MMNNQFPIHDLFVRKLEVHDEGRGIRIPLLSFNDHLLRRFGFVESVHLEPGHLRKMQVRAVADETWALIEGKVRFGWIDLRPSSPTNGQKYNLISDTPILVLAPFGVAFGVEALEKPALLLRLASHTEGVHGDDYNIPWEFD